MTAQRRYNKPCILEALCEVRFATPDDWNTASYGMLMAAVKDMGFEQTEELHTLTPYVDSHGKPIHILFPPVLMRYKHSDGKKLLHLGQNSFTINQLAPYSGWHEFKPYIMESLRRFHEALPSIQPSWLVLRYINRFEFTVAQIDLAEWFALYPNSPHIGRQKGPFLLRQDFFCAGEDVLTATTGLAYLPSSAGIAVLLDIEYHTPEFAWDFRMVDSILERAHSSVYEAFEACITDRTRQMLEEVR